MVSHGIDLDELGMDAFFAEFIRQYIQPVARAAFTKSFKNESALSLDLHRAFTVQYSDSETQELALHWDDSEVFLHSFLS